MCGATERLGIASPSKVGLSPRVRGNLGYYRRGHCSGGPIPACAGQPHRRAEHLFHRRAYPRVCGATVKMGLLLPSGMGLSPRVRGNPVAAASVAPRSGPIPACAGQPWVGTPGGGQLWAYPRVCGATLICCSVTAGSSGLSPRVRGNLVQEAALVLRHGPIPACAGQPACNAPGPRQDRAYPRVCGATGNAAANGAPLSGLSPRVRGNLINKMNILGCTGPIPACAGQPKSFAFFFEKATAYPRVCGATPFCCDGRQSEPGLSPRVRGNRRCRGVLQGRAGPIPACAGQP